MTKYLISCCEADQPKVEPIYKALIAAGLDVQYCRADIDLKTNFTKWMRERIGDCDILLSIWSRNCTEDRVFSMFERDSFLKKNLEGKAAYINIMLDNTPIIEGFDNNQPFRLYQSNVERFVEILLDDAKQPTTKRPPSTPTFKNIPLTPDRSVEGRVDDLARLRDTLTDKGKAAIIKATGGMGKTTIARHYIEQHHSDYNGILWLHAETASEMATDFSTLALHLNQNIPQGTPLEAVAQHLFNQLTGKWLIVYDNVEDEKALKGLLAEAPTLHVIITSRWTDWPDKYGPLDVAVLPPEPATDLLMSESGRTDDRQGAATLAEALGHLPLALVAAGGWLKYNDTSFADYATQLEDAIQQSPSGEYPDSVMGAVKLSYDACSEDARALLDLFAWCATDLIEPWLVENVAEPTVGNDISDHISQVIKNLATDKARLASAMTKLRQRALLTPTGDALSLHRMSAAAIRALQGEGRSHHHVTAAAVIAARYPGNAASQANWDQCRRLTPHALALSNHDPLPENNALGFLLNQSSIYLRNQGRLGEATALAEKNLDIKFAVFGPDHMETRAAHTQLGNCLSDAEQFEAAEKAYAEALRISRLHEDRRADLAIDLSNHALALSLLEKFQDAASEYQEALEINIELHGPNAPEVGINYNNLAMLHHDMGDLPKAIEHATKAFKIEEDQEKPDLQSLGFRTNNLGGFLFKNNELKAAEDLLTRAYDIRTRIYENPQHGQTLATASWLVDCLLTRAEHGEEPEKRAARAIEILNAHPSLKKRYGL